MERHPKCCICRSELIKLTLTTAHKNNPFGKHISKGVVFMSKIKLIITGLITGFVNGLFGAGGGMILVPAMQRFLKIETHKSHASAIAVILPLSLVSAFVYLRGVPADWGAVLWVSLGGTVGGFIGAKWLKKISSGKLHKLFGAVMALAAIRMIWG